MGMLCLSRKVGEKIKIGDDITLVVVAINGNRVKLGVEAPQETLILREEIINKKDGINGGTSE